MKAASLFFFFLDFVYDQEKLGLRESSFPKLPAHSTQGQDSLPIRATLS